MMMMDRRAGDETCMRQAKGIDGEDTNERHPRVALLTIPSGDILIEGEGVAENAVHGRHPRYWSQHAAWFVLLWWLLLMLLFMMMMEDRRVGDEMRIRQATGIDGEDTNERRPRVALLTIPSGDILIEGISVQEHVFHGRHPRYYPPCRVVFVVVVVVVVVVDVVVRDDDGSPCG